MKSTLDKKTSTIHANVTLPYLTSWISMKELFQKQIFPRFHGSRNDGKLSTLLSLTQMGYGIYKFVTSSFEQYISALKPLRLQYDAQI